MTKIDRFPTKAETDLLRQFLIYKFATIDQLMRACGLPSASANHLRYTQLRLNWLSDREHGDKPTHRYLLRLDRSRTGTGGSLKPAYHLSKKGQEFLRSLGFETTLYKAPTPGHLDHVLAVNEVILLAQALPAPVRVTEVKHDYDLKAMQLPFVSPDCFVHLLLALAKPPGAVASYPLLIEVDRGTESQKHISAKITGYIAFTKGTFQARFKLHTASIVLFVTTGKERLANIKATIEQTLTQLHQQSLGQFFFLALLQPQHSPVTVFLSPYFQQPFQGEALVPLISVPSLS